MPQVPDSQTPSKYADDRPADSQRADGIIPTCTLAAATCPASCDTCHPTSESVCMRLDCRWTRRGPLCTRDCLTPPPVVSPATCTGRPEACTVCNPTEALCYCCDCGAVVTDATWPDHIPACPRPHPPDPADRMPMVNPYVAQLMIELLDIIRIRAPFDTAHVIRAADRADIPITNTGVMRLLRRPLDQRTTTALTAELARYGEVYLDMVERSRVELRWIPTGDGRHWIVPDPPRTDQDPYWEDHLDPHMSDNTQTRLRHHIKTAVTR